MTIYVSPNYKTKKELVEAIKMGRKVIVYAAGLGEVSHNGQECVCGPHFPAAHKWYANVTVENGQVTKVK